MATYTTNYNLHQWEASDSFLRTDFNTDFGIIDAALGTIPKVATGSYVGTGTYGKDNSNTLTFSFKPSAVVLFEPGEEPLIFSSLGTPENAAPLQGGVIGAYWEGTILTWWSRDATLQHNVINHQYHYFAL